MRLTKDVSVIVLKELLRIFRNQNRELFLIEGIGSYAFVNQNDIIQLEITGNSDASVEKAHNFLLSTGLVENNTYQIENKNNEIFNEFLSANSILENDNKFFEFTLEIIVENDFKAQNQFKVGSKAYGEGLLGYGTYGWLIEYNGELCMLSNWHVLCPNGNNTALGTSVYINDNIEAKLIYFERINDSALNEWDFAIARINNPSDAIAQFSYNCNFEVPTKLEFSPNTNDIYATVGARPPHCSEGKFRGLSDVKVDYKNGRIYAFKDQMLFTKMSDPGDSGSIAFNKFSNAASSLIFAGNDRQSVGNPLYYYDNWEYRGTSITNLKKDNDYLNVPRFESSQMNSNIVENNPLINDTSSFKEVPRNIGGANRVSQIIDIPNNVGLSILDAKGEWLYIEVSLKGRACRGWTFGSSGKIWLDQPLPVPYSAGSIFG